MAAKISHSLPKPHEPIFLPSKSATESMPSSGQRDLQGAGLLEDLRDVGELDALASIEPSTFGTQAIAKSTSPADERVLRHDVAAGGDDLDVVEALLLEVALVERRRSSRRTGPAAATAAAA